MSIFPLFTSLQMKSKINLKEYKPTTSIYPRNALSASQVFIKK